MGNMTRKQRLESKLRNVRRKLNEQGFMHKPEGALELTSNFNDMMPFVVAYGDVIIHEYPECGTVENALGGADIFDAMSEEGLDDEQTIGWILGRVEDDECEDEDEAKIDESMELTEGTSNFYGDGGADWLPLLVFMPYEDVYVAVREAAEDEYIGQEDEDDYEEKIESFIDEHWDEYSNGVCVLDEPELEELDNDLHLFNQEIQALGDELAYGEGSEDDAQFDRGTVLKDIEVRVEPGYYEGAQIFVGGKDARRGWWADAIGSYEEQLTEEDKEKISHFLNEIKKKYGLTELSVSYRASNGETGYKIVDEEEVVEEAVNRNLKKITGNKNLKESVDWNYFDRFSSLEDKYLPDSGEGDNKATQAATATTKLIYKWYNDGDVFDNTYHLEGWANDLSSYANWLYLNIPETRKVLMKIKTARSESDYEDLLKELADLIYDESKLSEWENEDKEDSVYNRDSYGPFKFDWDRQEEESLKEGKKVKQMSKDELEAEFKKVKDEIAKAKEKNPNSNHIRDLQRRLNDVTKAHSKYGKFDKVANESLKEGHDEDLAERITEVLDDYGILYGDIVDEKDKVRIVGVDESEWQEAVDAISMELGLGVLVPEEDHEEFDDELIVTKESLKEDFVDNKTNKQRHDNLTSYQDRYFQLGDDWADMKIDDSEYIDGLKSLSAELETLKDDVYEHDLDTLKKNIKSRIVRLERTVNEDTVKQGSHWVNKGKEGTHGKFKTKKEADAQRKAMFARGYKEDVQKERHMSDGPLQFENLVNESAEEEIRAILKPRIVGDNQIRAFADDEKLPRGFRFLSSTAGANQHGYVRYNGDRYWFEVKDGDVEVVREAVDNPYAKQRKLRKEKGVHVNLNAGDPKKNMDAFNHAMGECSVTEDVESERSGLANEFGDNVKDEWDAIDGYNTLETEILGSSLTEEEKEKLLAIIHDIRDEEYRHVGQLQQGIKTVAPDAKNIEAGTEEAKSQEDTHHEVDHEQKPEEEHDEIEVEVEDEEEAK